MNFGRQNVPTPASRRRSRALRALPALAALALLAGCGGGGGGSSATTLAPVMNPPTPILPILPTPIPAAPSVSAPALGSFTASLAENAANVAVGGTVDYTVTLTNTSGAAATVTASTTGGISVPNASLSVSNAAGRTVYPPSNQPGARPQDVPPPPPIGTGVVTLQPGQSISQTRALAVFGTAGTYQAVAAFSVAASGADTPQTVTLPALAVTAQ